MYLVMTSDQLQNAHLRRHSQKGSYTNYFNNESIIQTPYGYLN